ncbi:hypothetical protein KIPB_001620 [Kipferlia bialata]|uniref:N-acetyltransferase ESCO zinc-finger domain-containing protein n=1 Tax=Kipferlia bialata TaxID=797122 RepID=A0A9K3CR19_9EUKA|nr:hypothetical protein KIPB_001620 [Kipferlia bialata]|eukprot:g1620.t1
MAKVGKRKSSAGSQSRKGGRKQSQRQSSLGSFIVKGPRTCRVCGYSYVSGDRQGEQDHRVFHQSGTVGIRLRPHWDRVDKVVYSLKHSVAVLDKSRSVDIAAVLRHMKECGARTKDALPAGHRLLVVAHAVPKGTWTTSTARTVQGSDTQTGAGGLCLAVVCALVVSLQPPTACHPPLPPHVGDEAGLFVHSVWGISVPAVAEGIDGARRWLSSPEGYPLPLSHIHLGSEVPGRYQQMAGKAVTDTDTTGMDNTGDTASPFGCSFSQVVE